MPRVDFALNFLGLRPQGVMSEGYVIEFVEWATLFHHIFFNYSHRRLSVLMDDHSEGSPMVKNRHSRCASPDWEETD